MNNALLLFLLFLAVSAGWTLGRGGLRLDRDGGAQLPSQYYRGFNFLLDGEEEDAVDAFTEALAVNEETLDTHIALGSVLRKRGEVDRAIRIHQSLLARPNLTSVQLHQSHLELARDFIAAGLHDRAEQLLLDLAEESQDLRLTAQRHLLEVYEAQRDWQAAERIASTLSEAEQEGVTSVGQSPDLLRMHYLCERAEHALSRSDEDSARALLSAALAVDESSPRALMGLARLERAAGQPERALANLNRVVEGSEACAPDVLELLEQTCAESQDQDALLNALKTFYRLKPSPTLALAVADEIARRDSPAVATDFLRTSLGQHASLSVVARLLLADFPEEASRPERALLRSFSQDHRGYQCGHCGLASSTRHWHCPACRHWGSIRYVEPSSGGGRA